MWYAQSFFIVYKNLLANFIQNFPTDGMGESPHQPKICSFSPSPPNFYSLPPKFNSTQQQNKNVIISCSHCSCSIFILISYSFETHIMLILVLSDVQYSQNTVFSFEKFSNHQNCSSSGSQHLVKKSPEQCLLLFDTKSRKLLKF